MATPQKQLNEKQRRSIEALRYMGWSEARATERVMADESLRDKPPPKQPPKARELTAKPGTRTIMMSEAEVASFNVLKRFGKSDAQALEWLEQKRGHKFSDARRFAPMAPMTFRPPKKSVTARLLTNHNAGLKHDSSCCPACCSRHELNGDHQ